MDALGPHKGSAQLLFHAQVGRRTEDVGKRGSKAVLAGAVHGYRMSDINRQNIHMCESHEPCPQKNLDVSECLRVSGVSEHSAIETCAK